MSHSNLRGGVSSLWRWILGLPTETSWLWGRSARDMLSDTKIQSGAECFSFIHSFLHTLPSFHKYLLSTCYLLYWRPNKSSQRRCHEPTSQMLNGFFGVTSQSKVRAGTGGSRLALFSASTEAHAVFPMESWLAGSFCVCVRPSPGHARQM